MERGRAPDFPRAQNTRDLGCLGDPERWGGAAEIAITVPTGRPSDLSAFSPQLIRVQVPDLIARAWEVLCFWKFQGVMTHDTVALQLECTPGCGQANGRGLIRIAPALVASPPSWWIHGTDEGTTQLTQPIPAVAMAIRAKLLVSNTGADPAHTVTAAVSVLVAPRSL